ncbi:MAG: PadR family transcriptional regulator [Dehalococcoidia bacterium]
MNDDFPILAAVAANPTHPYALLEHLQGCGLPVTRSTLYRRVEALVAQGWLDADDIRGESGHYRRALTLSKRGRERVTAEAREVIQSEALESPVFSLAVAVMSQGGVEVLAKALKPRMAAAARQLTSEERSLKAATDRDWSAAAKERRVAHLQADLSWLQGLMGRRLVVDRTELIRRAS